MFVTAEALGVSHGGRSGLIGCFVRDALPDQRLSRFVRNPRNRGYVAHYHAGRANTIAVHVEDYRSRGVRPVESLLLTDPIMRSLDSRWRCRNDQIRHNFA